MMHILDNKVCKQTSKCFTATTLDAYKEKGAYKICEFVVELLMHNVYLFSKQVFSFFFPVEHLM